MKTDVGKALENGVWKTGQHAVEAVGIAGLNAVFDDMREIKTGVHNKEASIISIIKHDTPKSGEISIEHEVKETMTPTQTGIQNTAGKNTMSGTFTMNTTEGEEVTYTVIFEIFDV